MQKSNFLILTDSYYYARISIHDDTQNDDTAGFIKSSAVIAKL